MGDQYMYYAVAAKTDEVGTWAWSHDTEGIEGHITASKAKKIDHYVFNY